MATGPPISAKLADLRVAHIPPHLSEGTDTVVPDNPQGTSRMLRKRRFKGCYPELAPLYPKYASLSISKIKALQALLDNRPLLWYTLECRSGYLCDSLEGVKQVPGDE
jgi:hypothetical protein